MITTPETPSTEPVAAERAAAPADPVIAVRGLRKRYGDFKQKTAYEISWRLEFRRVLFRSDRKSTRLNSSHQLISYAVF